MKKILFVILLTTAAVGVFGQKFYIHLKNGSVIKGKLVYSNDPAIIRIKSSGNIFVFNTTEIDTITLRKTHLTKATLNTVEKKTTQSPMDFNYFFRAGADILAGNPDNEQTAPGLFTASFNYHAYKNTSAGIGSGMEFYNQVTFIPLYANLEYRFRNTRISPVIFLKTGYLFASGEPVTIGGYDPYNYDIFIPDPNYTPRELDPHGGFMINPGIGTNIMVSNGFGFFLGFGYRYHKIGFNGDDGYSLDYKYNRLSISLGIIFK